jgi:hypothetical protein
MRNLVILTHQTIYARYGGMGQRKVMIVVVVARLWWLLTPEEGGVT